MQNTTRFSDRVDDYRKHRPTYPRAIIEHLFEAGYLFDGATVADVGAGTGIFTRLLVEAGLDVIAVEPNAPMAEALSAEVDAPHCVIAPAEATTLDDASVDLVTAAQALHWFDPQTTRTEFRRITRPPHRLAAVWNRRDTTSTPFLVEYEALLRSHGIGYVALMAGRDELEASLLPFFGHDDYAVFHAPQTQRHEWDGLVGRLLSSSYGPKPGHPDHAEVMRRLRDIFDRHAHGGEVEIIYDCRVHYGEMRS